MKNIFIRLLLFFSIPVMGQNFIQIGPDILIDEGEVSQTKIQSFIYLGGATDYNNIKNDIYYFFDPQINQNPQDYTPSIEITTSYLFIIYKKTGVINENFVFNENADSDKNPLIYGHNNDIIATVNYSISSNKTKSIFFYEDKNLVKHFFKNEEKALSITTKDRFKIDNMF